MYRARFTSPLGIVKVEVERLTDKSVWIKLPPNWINGPKETIKRRSIEKCSEAYFPSFIEAKDALVASCEGDVDHARRRLDRARSALDMVKKFKEDE
jgi:hypothetical protein